LVTASILASGLNLKFGLPHKTHLRGGEKKDAVTDTIYLLAPFDRIKSTGHCQRRSQFVASVSDGECVTAACLDVVADGA
jgi:hypothetical protein